MKFFSISVAVSFFIITNLSAQYRNVQISGPLDRLPNEVTITINPASPNYIAAGANVDIFYSSSDYGLSWSEKRITSSLFGVRGDPSLIYDRSGYLFYGHLSLPPSYALDRIVVQRSTDNGAVFDQGAAAGFNLPKEQDKEWLGVDMHSSLYKNNLYLTWTEFDKYGSSSSLDSTRILFSRSTDRGLSWSAPVRVSDRLGNCIDSDSTVEGAVPTVGPEGEVYTSWSGPLGIMFDKSTDGGLTWGADVFVSTQPGGWDFPVSGNARTDGFPVIACDTTHGAGRGNIYICWGDQRNGIDNSDVFISRSTDGGNTWSEALRVNDDNSLRHQFFPWLCIDQTTGKIYVVFYDRRSTTGDGTDVYVARSTDGGLSFQNVKVSESTFIATFWLGDYMGIAAYNKQVYPIWARTEGFDQSIWTALIADTSEFLTTIRDPSQSIPGFNLYQNYPNPFNPSTTIAFELTQSGHVQIKLYNILGKEISTILDEEKNSGLHEVTFNASNLNSGIYMYRMITGSYSKTRKLILMK